MPEASVRHMLRDRTTAVRDSTVLLALGWWQLADDLRQQVADHG
ncbi:hypothetical protein [Nocardia sp. CA-119907]